MARRKKRRILPGIPIKGIPSITDIYRFMSFVSEQPAPPTLDVLGKCWIWTGGTDQWGYGRFKFKNKNVRATRFAFTVYRRDLLSGEEVDHNCFVAGCVSPWHFGKPLTREENNAKKNPGRVPFKKKEPPLPTKPDDGIPI